MSKRTSAIASLRGHSHKCGGAHLTIQARDLTAERFVNTMYEAGKQIVNAKSIRCHHITTYIVTRIEQGIGLRTLQNEMAHIRGLLINAGRAQFAMSPQISNEELNIGGSSRDGTNTFATDAQYKAAVDKMMTRDQGMVAVLKLERTIGLRSQEAISSGESLKTWEKALRKDDLLYVIFGTKGGRGRFVQVPDREAALKAVRFAIAVANLRGGHLLEGNLKQASTHYRNEMHRHIEITGHQLRYSFARELNEYYLAQGLTHKEANAATSIALGHGDGRGKYVDQVYLR